MEVLVDLVVPVVVHNVHQMVVHEEVHDNQGLVGLVVREDLVVLVVVPDHDILDQEDHHHKEDQHTEEGVEEEEEDHHN